MFYLKKRITLLPEGILVQPNGTYIPKLINMLKISGRRKKVFHIMRFSKHTIQSFQSKMCSQVKKRRCFVQH